MKVGPVPVHHAGEALGFVCCHILHPIQFAWCPWCGARRPDVIAVAHARERIAATAERLERRTKRKAA